MNPRDRKKAPIQPVKAPLPKEEVKEEIKPVEEPKEILKPIPVKRSYGGWF